MVGDTAGGDSASPARIAAEHSNRKKSHLISNPTDLINIHLAYSHPALYSFHASLVAKQNVLHVPKNVVGGVGNFRGVGHKHKWEW